MLKENKNPIVISNTLLSLAEIENMKGEKLINPDFEQTKKIVESLPECSEWGQVSILEILCHLNIKDKK